MTLTFNDHPYPVFLRLLRYATNVAESALPSMSELVNIRSVANKHTSSDITYCSQQPTPSSFQFCLPQQPVF